MKSCRNKNGGVLGPTGHRWKYRKHIAKDRPMFTASQLARDHRVVFTCADCAAMLRVHSNERLTIAVEPRKRRE